MNRVLHPFPAHAHANVMHNRGHAVAAAAAATTAYYGIFSANAAAPAAALHSERWCFAGTTACEQSCPCFGGMGPTVCGGSAPHPLLQGRR